MIRLNEEELNTVKTTEEYNLLKKLKGIAVDFLKKEYNLSLHVPIEISGRMKSTLGSFYYQKGQFVVYSGSQSIKYPIVPLKICLSRQLFLYYTEEETIDTLKHELVHYALGMLGKPFSDGDKYFKDELDRLGVSRTRTGESKGILYQYKCVECNKEVNNFSKGYDKKYICGNCNNKFIYVGEKVIK